jgi:ectoine hydroxylase-related dioxygenase (phytanoyl-CoA dioxygenase family)
MINTHTIFIGDGDFELNESGIRSYHENGFLVVSDLFTVQEKEDIVEWTREVEGWPETHYKWMQYFEPNRLTRARQLCRTENFIPYHAGLRGLLCGEKIMSAVRNLLGEPAALYKDKINFKLPGANGFEPHQDAPAYTEHGQKSHVTSLIAVDEATTENGCLEVARGGHNLGLLPHSEGNGAIPEELARRMGWEPLLLQPGDVVFFGSYIPHRSGPNYTDRPRRSYYLTYNALSEGDKRDAYYRDKRSKFPPECEREKGKDYSEGARIYNLANPIRYFD